MNDSHLLRDQCKEKFNNIVEDIKQMRQSLKEHQDRLGRHSGRISLLEQREEWMIDTQKRNGKLLVMILLALLSLVGALGLNAAVQIWG